MKNQYKHISLIVLLGIILFIPFLGSVHLFDWDEINFAECAREMLVTHNYFSVKINYQPFWEKPPVFIWMQALSMNLFGINEFAARLPNAICGIVTLVVLYRIGKKIVDERFGLIWVMVYASSFLPFFYFKSGIIDPWFNLFTFSGIYYFVLFSNNKRFRSLLFSAILIGIAILTKGPVALLIFGLCFSVYWIVKRTKTGVKPKDWIIYFLTVGLVGSLWFIMLLVTGNSKIIMEFFLYQVRLFNTEDAGHGGIFLYHWIVLLIGCFPLSIFALRSFKPRENDSPFLKHFKLWMIIILSVVLILFSIVETKIIHYSSLCYFPLSFLATYIIYKLINREIRWKNTTSNLLILIGSLIGACFIAIPVINSFKSDIISNNLIDDAFAIENLKASVSWTGFEALIGLFLIIGTIAMVFTIKNHRTTVGIIGIFITSLLSVDMASAIITPRIEQYSQGAAIEFYKYVAEKDCYLETIGFKSYAYLFYSAKKQPTNQNSYNMEWLLRGHIDKPAYFVCKINDLKETMTNYKKLKEIYRKNGFVFLVHLPGLTKN